ncbi:uncharacterized protein LOC131659364 [Vicia villosa]|uniref:uncharacterized protein LOC131659364 n=1 Tax=Vicia villosa TaxID=3911 RepID=UPI00273C8A0B|nr:uncharacterized protein LOC131659364 [Vicia villosa]
MEGREGINPGITVIGAEAPSAYHVAPGTEAPNQVHKPEAVSAVVTAGAAADASVVVVSPVSVGLDGSVKKKRGRPRKYEPNGSVNMALSPLPISSLAPPSTNDFSSVKRGKPQGMEYKRAKKVVMDHLDIVAFFPSLNSVHLHRLLLVKAEETLFLWERDYLPIDSGVVLLDIAFVPEDPYHIAFIIADNEYIGLNECKFFLKDIVNSGSQFPIWIHQIS